MVGRDGRIGRRGVLAGFGALAAGMPSPAFAQAAWPTGRQLRLIVPFPPAGATDNLARIVGQRLSEKWAVPIVVENRAGAGGNIGTDVVKNAAPDGNTFLIVSVGMATNQYLYPRLTYDPVADFVPSTLVAMVPNILIVGRHVPVNSVAELIARAKANPGMTYGTSGVGTSVHLSGELFQRMTGTQLTPVHYRGSAQATQDLIGGRIDMIFDNISQSLPQVRAGNVKALGITTARRSQFAPELAPVAETVPGFDVTSWFAFFFPARTPEPIVRKLRDDTHAVLQEAGVRERLAALGAEAVGSTPEDLAAHLKRESETWGRLIRDANIRAE